MGTLQMVLLAWGVVTAILVCMWIYRSALENREEDQIFLDAAGDSMAQEQRLIVARIEKLSASDHGADGAVRRAFGDFGRRVDLAKHSQLLIAEPPIRTNLLGAPLGFCRCGLCRRLLCRSRS